MPVRPLVRCASPWAGRMSASAEIGSRQRVRGSMIEWARLDSFEPALHHRLLCSKLEAVARGEIRKLLFVLPPGAGKSIYCNLWVPWYMARSPGKWVSVHPTRLNWQSASRAASAAW